MDLRIKEIIKAKGLTMQQVADRLNIARDTLTRNINGNPTVDTLQRIATAIGCNVSEFFGSAGTRDALQCPHCGKPITVRIE